MGPVEREKLKLKEVSHNKEIKVLRETGELGLRWRQRVNFGKE